MQYLRHAYTKSFGNFTKKLEKSSVLGWRIMEGERLRSYFKYLQGRPLSRNDYGVAT